MAPSPSSSLRRSSSSSSCSSASSPATPPPATAASSVPFSWEEHPGVPKPSPAKLGPGNPAALPLPPPLRCNSDPFPSLRRRRKPAAAADADPFAVALLECSRRCAAAWTPPQPPKLAPRRLRRQPSGLGLRSLDLYASCKATCAVADSAVYVPRAGRYAVLDRRTP